MDTKTGSEQSITTATLGIKHDTDKLRVDLIPAAVIEGLAKVYTMGAAKYADRNWEKGILYSRLYASVQRHLLAFWRGEDNDPESGLLHLWHAMWGCGALAFYQLYPRWYEEFDDRPTYDIILNRIYPVEQEWFDLDAYDGTPRYNELDDHDYTCEGSKRNSHTEGG